MKKLPEFAIRLEPMTDEARGALGFKWASEEVGRRSKLGGEPDFLQDEDWPICPDCGEPMSFYAQLDSLSDKFIIADSGMVYVFLCFGCNETKSIIQSN